MDDVSLSVTREHQVASLMTDWGLDEVTARYAIALAAGELSGDVCLSSSDTASPPVGERVEIGAAPGATVARPQLLGDGRA